MQHLSESIRFGAFFQKLHKRRFLGDSYEISIDAAFLHEQEEIGGTFRRWSERVLFSRLTNRKDSGKMGIRVTAWACKK